MTRRLLALAVLAALMAPWAAPCLLADSGSAVMPCCPKPDPSAPPTLRPCCPPADQQPITLISATVAASMSAVPAMSCATLFSDRLAILPVAAPPKPGPSADHFRSTVLLI